MTLEEDRVIQKNKGLYLRWCDGVSTIAECNMRSFALASGWLKLGRHKSEVAIELAESTDDEGPTIFDCLSNKKCLLLATH